MELRILGPIEVGGTGRAVGLGGRRERALLAALVTGAGEVVATDRLVDALWRDEPPRTAAKTLQNYVLRLRKMLGASAIGSARAVAGTAAGGARWLGPS